MRFRSRGGSFAIALVLLVIEIGIARYAHDRFVRPFLGDVLVVPLVYFALATVLRDRRLAPGVLVLACCVEVLQYFDYVALLHLEHNRLLSTTMGRTFQWSDFVAYAAGYGLVVCGLRWPLRADTLL